MLPLKGQSYLSSSGAVVPVVIGVGCFVGGLLLAVIVFCYMEEMHYKEKGHNGIPFITSQRKSQTLFHASKMTPFGMSPALATPF